MIYKRHGRNSPEFLFLSGCKLLLKTLNFNINSKAFSLPNECVSAQDTMPNARGKEVPFPMISRAAIEFKFRP